MGDLDLQFGQIDIYLFDQLLRGRLQPGMRVLDAGCGSGRNLVYLLRSGYEVFGADTDVDAIEAVRVLAATLAPELPGANFRAEAVEIWFGAFADAVRAPCATSPAAIATSRPWCGHGECSPGGLLFCRLASAIGMETRVRQTVGRRFLLPDGSERYLVDEALLVELTRRLGGAFLDPLKTTIVQNQRCMTTWVVRKGA
jgi:hypothetical protein